MLKGVQLSCRRSNQEIFSKLTFSLKPSTLLHIVGPNGSGKSTLLRMIAGLLPIEIGVIESDLAATINTKHTLTGLLSENALYNSNLLYIGHKTGLTLSLTPKENIELWQGLKAYPAKGTKEGIDNTLTLFNLTAYYNTPCDELSFGQQQKVVLLRLWMETAPLWILDEPFTAIDKLTQHLVETQIKQHLAKGGAVLMANHSPMDLAHTLGESYKTMKMPTV